MLLKHDMRSSHPLHIAINLGAKDIAYHRTTHSDFVTSIEPVLYPISLVNQLRCRNMLQCTCKSSATSHFQVTHSLHSPSQMHRCFLHGANPRSLLGKSPRIQTDQILTQTIHEYPLRPAGAHAAFPAHSATQGEGPASWKAPDEADIV